MKTLLKLCVSCFLILGMAAPYVNAQSSNKELKKDLKSKVEKDSRKTAKELKKEGWKVMPGKLPLERQIQDSRYAELSKDANGDKAYFIATHQAVGGNYSAAKKIADDRARLELAASIGSTVSEMIKGQLSSTNYGEGDIETIDEVVSASKNLVAARLQGVVPVLEIYREKKNNTYEVQVAVRTDAAAALKAAKKLYREELSKKSEKLANELDELLPY